VTDEQTDRQNYDPNTALAKLRRAVIKCIRVDSVEGIKSMRADLRNLVVWQLVVHLLCNNSKVNYVVVPLSCK